MAFLELAGGSVLTILKRTTQVRPWLLAPRGPLIRLEITSSDPYMMVRYRDHPVISDTENINNYRVLIEIA